MTLEYHSRIGADTCCNWDRYIINVEPELKKRVTELNLSFDVQIIQSEQVTQPIDAKIEGGSVQASRVGSEVKECL